MREKAAPCGLFFISAYIQGNVVRTWRGLACSWENDALFPTFTHLSLTHSLTPGMNGHRDRFVLEKSFVKWNEMYVSMNLDCSPLKNSCVVGIVEFFGVNLKFWGIMCTKTIPKIWYKFGFKFRLVFDYKFRWDLIINCYSGPNRNHCVEFWILYSAFFA